MLVGDILSAVIREAHGENMRFDFLQEFTSPGDPKLALEAAQSTKKLITHVTGCRASSDSAVWVLYARRHLIRSVLA
jgi:hypothetical protein